MFNYKMVIILTLFLITAGCQHTASNSAAPFETISFSASNTKNTKDTLDPSGSKTKADKIGQNFDPSDSNTVSVNLPHLSLPDETSDNPALINADEKTDKQDDADPNAQEKIDRALELCSDAQQMWEEGKLEEALSNLDSAYSSILEIDSDAPAEENQQKEDIRYMISKRILEIYASRQIVITGPYNEIPITLNTYVEDEIKRLTGPERQFLIESLERSQLYRPFIVAELKKAGLPEALSWLPLIESGFKIRALSSARALGLWQFIPSTGYKFGLTRNDYIDERLDPEKSTRAAINYLKDLHNLFGDWTTALASYNCGESRVLRIIRKQRINYLDNFWDLYQNLPRETSRYVPRFLATLHIVNNLEQYNIQINTPLSPIEYQLCEIKKQVHLKDIAEEIGVDTTILKELNAELRYALLPPEPYKLKIPVDKAELFLSKIDTIQTSYSPPPMYVFHRVRKGETVSEIAEKYKTSIRSVCQVNNINQARRIYAGKILKIPSRTNGPIVADSAAHKIPPGQTITYIVKRGDSLWNIARSFGITTKQIISANNMVNTSLSIGQTLHISNGNQPKTAKEDAATYQVCSGDSPFAIAKKHNMDVSRLLALNQLSKHSKIFPGQHLIVE
ncbi:MAG: LysM peptidoglycan-binding domain-containing protein [Pseudomonadota bacterium]